MAEILPSQPTPEKDRLAGVKKRIGEAVTKKVASLPPDKLMRYGNRAARVTSWWQGQELTPVQADYRRSRVWGAITTGVAALAISGLGIAGCIDNAGNEDVADGIGDTYGAAKRVISKCATPGAGTNPSKARAIDWGARDGNDQAALTIIGPDGHNFTVSPDSITLSNPDEETVRSISTQSMGGVPTFQSKTDGLSDGKPVNPDLMLAEADEVMLKTSADC